VEGRADVEGARVEWQALPVAYEGDGQGPARALPTPRRANKKPIRGAEFSIDAELVLVAIGQSKLGTLLSSARRHHHRRRSRRDGRARRDRPQGLVRRGDCRNGGKEVVNAAAEGKAAARAIHAFVTGASNA
jgi:dihydropyrimidine dehydrogenase (NAD+) subunit PreT